MHKGKHLLVDCRSVARETCLDDELILNVMANAARKAGATVISQVRYRFGEDSPPGCAAMVLLDESHCSAHSYADLGLLAIDVFTCGKTDPHEVLRHIVFDLKLEDFDVREFPRFKRDDETEPMTKAGAVSTT